jgi:ABC-type nickel/cobalt efflux system permease component RcnA
VIAFLSGLSAGVVHVVSGPDHLAAVAPLALDNWRRAIAIGIRWGLGHSSGVLFVGLLALVAREVLPVETLSGWAERLVGVLLIGIGIWGLRRSLKTRLHAHEHTHDGTTHLHYHAHGTADAHAPAERRAHQHTHTAFLIGTVHGIAGGSHFLGVLPALVFPSRIQSLLYLCAFAIGTVAGMIAFASALGYAGRRMERYPHGLRWLTSGACTAAILIGCYWMVA